MPLLQPDRHLRASSVSTLLLAACVVGLAHLLVLAAIPIDLAHDRATVTPLNVRVLPASTLAASSAPKTTPSISPTPAARRNAPSPVDHTTPRTAAEPARPAAPPSDAPIPDAAMQATGPSNSGFPVAPSLPSGTFPTPGPRQAPTLADVQPPSSSADYLDNPQPAYPAISRRLGEQGRVVIRVLIGADGLTKQASVAQSSGFPRLDQTALETVQHWRFLPGRRAGVAQAMWHQVPITFTLE